MVAYDSDELFSESHSDDQLPRKKYPTYSQALADARYGKSKEAHHSNE